jgi:23S rRNA (cytidine1920-2'-O)/16S rRNA (cytidine1409-2'-O)-methyltransferase
LKERLDKLLVSKGLVKSRELARALIIEGKAFVDGRKVTKAGTPVKETSEILLKEPSQTFVGRGGLKLDAALVFFGLDVKGKVIMDVGSSTGGFTDCLLKRGAGRVYCIDVGYGQLAWSLRTDPRVVLLERTNIRHLESLIKEQPSKFAGAEFEALMKGNVDTAVVDVSFISLTKVIPAMINFLKEDGEILALVKPQFEVGKGEVGKGGIVRDEKKRSAAVGEVERDLKGLGLRTAGTYESPVHGQKGNVEIFLYMKK